MDVFTVYDTNLERIRLGEAFDGGYVIFDGLEYDHLLSGGIERTIQFEEDFIKKYNVTCDAFDNSIRELPKENSSINFHRKTISGSDTETASTLKSFLEQKQKVFIKWILKDGNGIGWNHWIQTI